MDKLKLLTLSLVGLGIPQHDKGQEGLIPLKEDKTSGCVSHERARQIYLTLQANVELVSSQCRR